MAAIGGVNARGNLGQSLHLALRDAVSVERPQAELRGGCGTLQVLQSRETQQ